MRFNLVVICFFIINVFYGQAPDFQWAHATQTPETGIINASVIDQEGNLYSTGTFEISLPYVLNGVEDTLFWNGGYSDLFIEKRNSNGELIWIKHIGGQGIDGGYSIALDNYGHVAIYGGFQYGVDINPGIEVDSLHWTPGNLNRFILKLESEDGEFIWAKHIAGPMSNFNSRNVIKFDKDGNIYHSGAFHGDFDIDPSPVDSFVFSSDNGPDVFILKLDSNGDFVWAKQVEIQSSGIGSSISSILDINSDNEIVVVGNFKDTIDLDIGAGTDYVYNDDKPCVYMMKLNSNGDLIWSKALIGEGSMFRCAAVKIDQGNNDIVMQGYFNDTIDFDPGLGIVDKYSTTGGTGVFVLKSDNNGEFDWVEIINGSGSSDAMGLDIDPNGNIYSVCTFYNSIEMSTLYGSSEFNADGLHDVLITKLNSQGNIIWGENYGVGYAEFVFEILADPNEQSIYTSGYFHGTTDFDPGIDSFLLTAQGECDGYILKLNTCNSASVDEYEQCEPLTWIDGITYNTTTNFEVTHTITNANGCDSTVYLNLTLPILDTNLSVMGIDLVSHQSGGTYQWLDCYEDYEEIPGENAINYAPQSDGSYAVEVTYGNCTIISECYEIQWFSTGEESIEEFKLYSNPLEDHFTINFGQVLDKASIRVYNVLGKEILQTFCLGGESKQLFIPEAKGVYFVDVNMGGGNRQFKLLKY